MGKFLAVSEKERQILELWAKHRNIKTVIEVSELKASTVYNRISRLRWRYHLAKEFIRDVERWFAKLPSPLEEV